MRKRNAGPTDPLLASASGVTSELCGLWTNRPMDSDPPAPHMHREVTTLGKKTVIYAVSMKNPWNAVA